MEPAHIRFGGLKLDSVHPILLHFVVVGTNAGGATEIIEVFAQGR